jgi:menaquinone-dependent protoporphyrinogen oxidase
MTRAAVFYATREGQAQKVAEFVADTLTRTDCRVDVRDVRTNPGAIDVDAYRFIFLVASVHLGKHEPEMVAFVKAHRTKLQRVPAAFLSVSLSQVGVEDMKLPRERREQHAADVRAMIEAFLRETAWRPARVKAVAGALRYRKYNALIRFVMKRIAKRAGGATDTSHNHEYTNWRALESFVRMLANEASLEEAVEYPASA